MHVGTFCVVDVMPRPDFGVREIEVLENLAAQAADYLEERALLRRPANFQLLQHLSSSNEAATENAAWDALVIGGGPAGLTAACRLSFQGLKVALVEPKASFGSPTGVSSKVLREVAMDHGAGTSWDDVLAIRQLIAQNDAKRVVLQLQRYGVKHFKGTGVISGCDANGTTKVVVSDGTTPIAELLAHKVVVSTGSKARRLKGIPFEQDGFYDSDSIGSLCSKPSSLFVQGTGIIALEYATIFAEMGVKVTVAARGKRDDLLPMLDGSMRDALLTDLEAKGVEILYQASVKSCRCDAAGPLVDLELPSGISERRFSAVLSAVGRVPTTQDLGMEALLEADDVTKLKKLPLLENQQLETNAGSVYVIGDVSGSGLACKAVMQAQGLVDHVLPSLVLKNKQASQPVSSRSSPSIIWAIPELAFVGSSQSEAIDSYGEAEVFSVLAPFADTIRGRLKALPASYFLKLVCLRQDGRILGVHVYGEGASELIHLGASLVADGNTVFDLQYKSFPAVTLHEVYRNAAMLAIDTLSGLAQKAG
jgi:NAD(P) transhydrogenase